MDAALDAVIVIDARGIVRAWNRGAEETFGWSDAEAVGEPMAELVVPEHLREGHNQGMARFLKTGEARVIGRRIEIDGLHRDGRVFLSSTILRGRFTLRLAVLSFRTHLDTIDLTIEILKEKAKMIEQSF